MKKVISVIIIMMFILFICKEIYASSSNYATSNKYKINEENRYIYTVDVSTPVLGFFSNLTVNSSLTYHVYDKDGNKKADDQKLVTGDLLMFKNREQYVISVTKDLNCDGKVTISDLAKLQRRILNPYEEISTESFLAGDSNFDDRLTVSDLASMQRYILNK